MKFHHRMENSLINNIAKVNFFRLLCHVRMRLRISLYRHTQRYCLDGLLLSEYFIGLYFCSDQKAVHFSFSPEVLFDVIVRIRIKLIRECEASDVPCSWCCKYIRSDNKLKLTIYRCIEFLLLKICRKKILS